MMRSTSVVILLFLSSTTEAAAASSAAASTASTSKNNNADRIKVPLHRHLVDVLSETTAAINSASTTTTSSSMNTKQQRRRRRQFEIEATEIQNDREDGQKITTTTLLVDEMEEMAITSRTTYSFSRHRRQDKFHPSYIQNVAILASRNNNSGNNNDDGSDANNNNSGGLTIISVNKANGNVRGILHGGGGNKKNNLKRILLDSTTNNKLTLQSATTTTTTTDDDDERSLREKVANWSCGAEHRHDYNDEKEEEEEFRHTHHHHHHHSRSLQHDQNHYQNSTNVWYQYVKSRSANPTSTPSSTTTTWIPPKKYTFHIPIYIEVDSTFVNRQGGINEAIEYVNFLTSAVNIIIEQEVDAHLEVIHVEETHIYDNITTTEEALRVQRLRPRENLLAAAAATAASYDDEYSYNQKFILVHALLGRHVGGGIAFIDTICETKWSFGVTSDIQGTFTNLGEDALLDMFYYAHELGHSLGSGHTYDAYEPEVDQCGSLCTLSEGLKSDPVGLPLDNSATIMSYCNFCTGGMNNIALTYGGLWDGVSPRSDVGHWMNHPDVAAVGTVSVEPRRVSYTIWNLLSAKVKECVEPPPSQPQGRQGCNDSSDCNDNRTCTIDVCSSESNVCVVSKTLDNCCGNGVCEQGEISADCSDCGPFIIKPPKPCDDCYALDGFIVEVGVSENAKQAISLTSISLQHKAPEQFSSSVEVFIARPFHTGEATELISSLWQSVATATFPGSEGLMEIDLPTPIIIGVAEKVEIYIAATEQLLQFGVGAYSIENDHGVQLHSSHAVSGRFGTAIESFALNCEVKYAVAEVTANNLPVYIVELKDGRLSELAEDTATAETTVIVPESSATTSATLNNEMESTTHILNDEVSSAANMYTIVYLSSAMTVVLFALLNIML